MKLLREIDTKKIVSWVGTVLMLIALAFIAQRLIMMRHDLNLSVLGSPAVIAALLLLAVMEGTVVILASLNYRKLVISASGIPVGRALSTKVYTVSNLYKYIPGGVLYVLGRNRIAIETQGIRHSKVFLATVTEGVLFAVGALILSVLLAFEHSIYYVRQLEIPFLVRLAFGLILLIAAVILFIFRRRLPGLFANSISSVKNFRAPELLRRLAVALLLITLWAGIFLGTLMLMGQPMTFSLGITVMGLFILSWLLGFLTPGAPSGIGIREAVMLMFMSGVLSEGILLTAMVVHRILAVLGDLAAYGMAMVYSAVSRKHSVSHKA